MEVEYTDLKGNHAEEEGGVKLFEDRRPLIFDNHNEKLYVGGFNQSHWDAHNWFELDGSIDDENRYSHGMWFPHGSSHGGRDGQGFPEGDLEWISPVADHHKEEINKTLGATPRPKSWYFSSEGTESTPKSHRASTLGVSLDSAWQGLRTAHSLEWQPGQNGKGYVDEDGVVHTWSVDDAGRPHHGEQLTNVHDSEEYGLQGYDESRRLTWPFTIGSDGSFSWSWDQGKTGKPPVHPSDADPRLRALFNEDEPGEWRFGSSDINGGYDEQGQWIPAEEKVLSGANSWTPGNHGKGLQLADGRHLLWNVDEFDGFPTHPQVINRLMLPPWHVRGVTEMHANGSVRPANDTGYSDAWARELAEKHNQKFIPHWSHPEADETWEFTGSLDSSSALWYNERHGQDVHHSRGQSGSLRGSDRLPEGSGREVEGSQGREDRQRDDLHPRDAEGYRSFDSSGDWRGDSLRDSGRVLRQVAALPANPRNPEVRLVSADPELTDWQHTGLTENQHPTYRWTDAQGVNHNVTGWTGDGHGQSKGSPPEANYKRVRGQMRRCMNGVCNHIVRKDDPEQPEREAPSQQQSKFMVGSYVEYAGGFAFVADLADGIAELQLYDTNNQPVLDASGRQEMALVNAYTGERLAKTAKEWQTPDGYPAWQHGSWGRYIVDHEGKEHRWHEDGPEHWQWTEDHPWLDTAEMGYVNEHGLHDKDTGYFSSVADKQDEGWQIDGDTHSLHDSRQRRASQPAEWQLGQHGKAAIWGSLQEPRLAGPWATDENGNPHHYEVMGKAGIGNFIALSVEPDGGLSVLFGDPNAADDAAKLDPRLHVKSRGPMDGWDFGHNGSASDTILSPQGFVAQALGGSTDGQFINVQGNEVELLGQPKRISSVWHTPEGFGPWREGKWGRYVVDHNGDEHRWSSSHVHDDWVQENPSRIPVTYGYINPQGEKTGYDDPQVWDFGKQALGAKVGKTNAQIHSTGQARLSPSQVVRDYWDLTPQTNRMLDHDIPAQPAQQGTNTLSQVDIPTATHDGPQPHSTQHIPYSPLHSPKAVSASGARKTEASKDLTSFLSSFSSTLSPEDNSRGLDQGEIDASSLNGIMGASSRGERQACNGENVKEENVARMSAKTRTQLLKDAEQVERENLSIDGNDALGRHNSNPREPYVQRVRAWQDAKHGQGNWENGQGDVGQWGRQVVQSATRASADRQRQPPRADNRPSSKRMVRGLGIREPFERSDTGPKKLYYNSESHMELPEGYRVPDMNDPEDDYKGLELHDGRRVYWAMYGHPYTDQTTHAALMEKMGIEPEQVSRYLDSTGQEPEQRRDDWRFASESRWNWRHGSVSHNWKPGQQGKWLITPDGDVHTWNVDYQGNPHHTDYAEHELGDQDIWHPESGELLPHWNQYEFGDIGAQGVSTAPPKEYHQQFESLGLQPRTDQWYFGSESQGTPTPDGGQGTWTVIPGLRKDYTETGHFDPYTPADQYTHHPLWFTEGNRIYIGNPGTHHNDLGDDFPDLYNSIKNGTATQGAVYSMGDDLIYEGLSEAQSAVENHIGQPLHNLYEDEWHFSSGTPREPSGNHHGADPRHNHLFQSFGLTPAQEEGGWHFGAENLHSDGTIGRDFPEGGLYHMAPTRDRERILQHGLQVSSPAYNQRWLDEAGSNTPPVWLQDQPHGVYGEKFFDDTEKWNYHSYTHPEGFDTWFIPQEQIKDLQQDNIGNAWVIPHSITHPILFKRREDMADISKKQWPEGWEQRPITVVGTDMSLPKVQVENLGDDSRPHGGGVPYVYNPRTDTIHIADKDGFHWDLINQVPRLEGVFGEENGRNAPEIPEGYGYGRYEGEPYYHNTEYDCGADNDRIHDALENHFGNPISRDPIGEWRFGSTEDNLHYNKWTGKPCSCPWGRKQKRYAKVAGQEINKILKAPDKAYRTPEGEDFRQNLAKWLGDEHDALAPYFANRYKKGDFMIEEHDGRLSSYYGTPGLEELRWIPFGILGPAHDWYQARQHPTRRGVNIMDPEFSPYELTKKVREHQEALRAERMQSEGLEEGEPVYKFKNGWHVRHLNAPGSDPNRALYAEGQAMGHCIGDESMPYQRAAENGETEVYSLRDKNNLPHGTWHTDPHGGIAEIHGRDNKGFSPRSQELFDEYVDHVGIGPEPSGYTFDDPYDTEIEVPGAEDLDEYLDYHHPEGSRSYYDYAHEYGNYGENTEVFPASPNWSNIVDSLIDGEHTPEERQYIYNTIHNNSYQPYANGRITTDPEALVGHHQDIKSELQERLDFMNERPEVFDEEDKIRTQRILDELKQNAQNHILPNGEFVQPQTNYRTRVNGEFGLPDWGPTAQQTVAQPPQLWTSPRNMPLPREPWRPYFQAKTGWKFANPEQKWQNGGHEIEDDSAYSDGKPSEPWDQGDYGKGFLAPDGTLHTWYTGEESAYEGWPHHQDILGPTMGSDWDEKFVPFQIDPNGQISTYNGEMPDHFVKAIADNPFFEIADNPIHPEWRFQGAWTPTESDPYWQWPAEYRNQPNPPVIFPDSVENTTYIQCRNCAGRGCQTCNYTGHEAQTNETTQFGGDGWAYPKDMQAQIGGDAPWGEFGIKQGSEIINGGHRFVDFKTGQEVAAPPWRRGLSGKGTYVNGQPHMWAVNDMEDPHHDEAIADYGVSDGGYFYIDPDGSVEGWGEDGRQAAHGFAAHHPDLHAVENPEWMFSKVASKIEWLESRPDKWKETHIGQNTLEGLKNLLRWYPKLDPLTPWMWREAKKRRISISENGSAHRIAEDGSVRFINLDTWGHLADWYESNSPTRRGVDIMQKNFDDIQGLVKEWDEELASQEIEANQNNGEIVHQYPNGWTMRKLGPKDLKYEGDQMGHCVGGYSYEREVESGGTDIYSLRDEKNIPHGTIELENNEVRYDQPGLAPAIEQIQGKGNTILKPEYQQMVKEFFATLPKKPVWAKEDEEINNIEQIINPEEYNEDHGWGGYGPHGDYGIEEPHRETDYGTIIHDLVDRPRPSAFNHSPYEHSHGQTLYDHALKRNEIPKLADAVEWYNDNVAQPDLMDLHDQNWEYLDYPGEYLEEAQERDPDRFKTQEDFDRAYEEYEHAQDELANNHMPSLMVSDLYNHLNKHYNPEAGKFENPGQPTKMGPPNFNRVMQNGWSFSKKANDEPWVDELEKGWQEAVENVPSDKAILDLLTPQPSHYAYQKGIELPDGTRYFWIPDQYGFPHHDEVARALKATKNLTFLEVENGRVRDAHDYSDNATWNF